MKKILIITNHSYMLWQFRRELIAKLMETNEIVLSMPFVGHEDDFKAMGLRCIETDIDRRGINPATDIRLLNTYRHMIADEKPDLVITYSIKPNIYAGWICSSLGIPYYANVQGLGTAFQKKGLSQIVTMLYKAALRNARAVFFENEANAEEFRKRHIVPKGKETVLSGAGVNLEFYSYQAYPDNKVPHFLYLGRIMKEKGMDELFYAVEKLQKTGLEFHVDLVGFFEDEYKEQVDKLQEEGIATFHGFQEDPRPFYASADCVVLPSYHEGMSNVLLEAAATGRPVITSDIPGCREAVEGEKSGFLVSPRDGESLYHAMKHFLTLPSDERSEMGQCARKRMEAHFSKEKVVKETIRVLGLTVEDEENTVTAAEESSKPTQFTGKQKSYFPVKRAMDVMIAGTFTVISAPFMGAIALAIKLDSPGPVLFKQERVGKDKETFEFWKFRTMRTDAPHDVPTHLLKDPDAYITRIGRFLRKYSLDELPQFWQVLLGKDMSIVGPRPALWNQEDLIAERDKYGANHVKPGITGWAQVNGRDELEIATKARFDGEYVKKMGIKMDIKCFLATIGSVLCHDGVVEGGTGEMHKQGEETGDDATVIVPPEKLEKEIRVGAAVVGVSVAAVVGVAAAIVKFKRQK